MAMISVAEKRGVMSHCKAVTRQNRTAFVLLLDLSGSMMEVTEYEGELLTKADVVAKSGNRILQELYMRATGSGECRDYYDVAVIGYSNGRLVSLLNDSLDAPFVSMLTLDKMCRKSAQQSYGGEEWIRVEMLNPLNSPERIDEAGDTTIVVVAEGETPMHEAMLYLYDIMEGWCNKPENMDSFPPSVYHITDGHPTDSDLEAVVDAARRVMSLRTNDGEVLLVNIHIDASHNASQMLFPTDEEIANHPDRYAQMMGRCSSKMPQSFEPFVREMRGVLSSEGYRGMGYGVAMADLISMMSIGTLMINVK